jgi:hypothetical protein
MIKRTLVTIGIILAGTSLKSQVVHEFGFGFSVLRILEPNTPGVLVPDLDYYWNPQFGYQLNFLNQKAIGGLQFGWVYAQGLTDEENYMREDLQKSFNLDVEAGWNLFSFNNSTVQLTAGVRLTKTYFYSQKVEETFDNGISTNTGLNEQWQDVDLDLTSTISYQFNLSEGRYRKSNIALRLSLEMVYFFPEDNELKFLEEDYRFAIGPSASIIWRIRGKKNRGLF